ncbi:MAG TPA: hypothetical protein VJ000_01335 [Thermodesulfovibrionia bacterium]|nr:hypothetical protein [Thermodesulfovibrionia bacterium]
MTKEIDVYVRDTAVISVTLDPDEIKERIMPIIQKIDLDEKSKIDLIQETLDDMVDEAFGDPQKVIVETRDCNTKYRSDTAINVFYLIQDEFAEQQEEEAYAKKGDIK